MSENNDTTNGGKPQRRNKRRRRRRRGGAPHPSQSQQTPAESGVAASNDAGRRRLEARVAQVQGDLRRLGVTLPNVAPSDIVEGLRRGDSDFLARALNIAGPSELKDRAVNSIIEEVRKPRPKRVVPVYMRK